MLLYYAGALHLRKFGQSPSRGRAKQRIKCIKGRVRGARVTVQCHGKRRKRYPAQLDPGAARRSSGHAVDRNTTWPGRIRARTIQTLQQRRGPCARSDPCDRRGQVGTRMDRHGAWAQKWPSWRVAVNEDSRTSSDAKTLVFPAFYGTLDAALDITGSLRIG
jgi:hypothetical protein